MKGSKTTTISISHSTPLTRENQIWSQTCNILFITNNYSEQGTKPLSKRGIQYKITSNYLKLSSSSKRLRNIHTSSLSQGQWNQYYYHLECKFYLQFNRFIKQKKNGKRQYNLEYLHVHYLWSYSLENWRIKKDKIPRSDN